MTALNLNSCSPLSRDLGHVRRLAIAATLVVALAGCQTAQISSIDTSNTAAISPTVHPASGDLQQGKLHFSQGNFGLAEQHFRKAVELNADSADGWLGLAATYDRLGRFDFADRAYEQLVKVAGRTPRIVNNMGYSQLLRGERGKARQLLNEARAAMPDDPVVLANLKLLDER